MFAAYKFLATSWLNHVICNLECQLSISGQCAHPARITSDKRRYRKHLRDHSLPHLRRSEAAAEHDDHLVRIQYVSVSTFLFRFLPTSDDDSRQFLVAQVISVVGLPRVVGLEPCHQSDPLDCLLVNAKIDSLGLSTSGHRLLHELLDYDFMLRDTFPLSVLIDGHKRFGFSD